MDKSFNVHRFFHVFEERVIYYIQKKLFRAILTRRGDKMT